jgi:hypothetical protein
MSYLCQSIDLKFRLIPVNGQNIVRSWAAGNLCTVEFLPYNRALRLIRLRTYARFEMFNFQDNYDRTVNQVGGFQYSTNGRWTSGLHNIYMPIQGCQFNCPVNFASLAVNPNDNWFTTNFEPIFEKDCFYITGFTIEELYINFQNPVDISPISAPNGLRYITLDVRYYLELSDE